MHASAGRRRLDLGLGVALAALVDVVGDSRGISRESAQLHLKTIRTAAEISFKGYGRVAAAMIPIDASRLVIASAGSIFAKDSADVLRRFAKLRRPPHQGRLLTDAIPGSGKS